MFANITQGFQKVFKTLRGYGKLSEKNIEDAIRQVRLSLLSADVNIGVVKGFIADVRGRALGSKVLQSLSPDQQFIKIVNEELKRLLGEPVELDLAHRPPVVIVCVGLQGSGKTTTVAKLAAQIKAKGKRCYLVPADLKRPAAVEQLKVLGAQIGTDVHPSKTGDDPVKVSCDALKEARRLAYDVVFIDTSGRLHIDDEMMNEVSSLAGEVKPHHTIFVADSMTGQDAVKSAKAFSEKLPITGVILTKLDGDARGGAALSIRKVTGSPILFVGVGEKMEALEQFWPDRMAARILGMGDVMTLIEKATEVVDSETAAEFTEKAFKKGLTLEDLRDQFRTMKKMGSIGKILGMLPMGRGIADRIENADLEGEIKVKEAIIDSMTPAERRNPRILNGSRRKRIALGSGTDVSDINRLIKEFEQMGKMMKKMGRGGMKGILGLMTRSPL